MANQELSKALEIAGNAAKLSLETGIPRRTVYDRVQRGFLSFEQAVKVGQVYGLDPLKLQER